MRLIKVLVGVVSIVLVCAVVVTAADEKPIGWDTTLAIGGAMTDGNSDTLAVNASLTTEREWEKHSIRMGVEANYGETDVTTTDAGGATTTSSEVTAQNLKAALNYKRTFDRLYGYTDNSILHDDLGGIDYRAILGVGVGGLVIDGEKSKLGVEFGLAFISEKLTNGLKDDKAALRIALRHDHQFSETAKAWAGVEYLPSTDDFGDYLVNGEVGADAALNSSLSLRVVLRDRYDSTPPTGNERNDLSLIGSIVCKL